MANRQELPLLTISMSYNDLIPPSTKRRFKIQVRFVALYKLTCTFELHDYTVLMHHGTVFQLCPQATKLIQFQCAGIQLVVGSLLLDQILMGAPFSNTAVIQHHDSIRILNSR